MFLASWAPVRVPSLHNKDAACGGLACSSNYPTPPKKEEHSAGRALNRKRPFWLSQ